MNHIKMNTYVECDTENKIDTNPQNTHCGGFVVFNPKLNKVALVKTPRGVWGFPKGKREPKKDHTILDCAFRELWEETSLKKCDINTFTEYFYYEINKNNRASVTLFLSMASKEHVLKIQDQEELREVKWIHIDKALTLLVTKNRSHVLKRAHIDITKLDHKIHKKLIQ